MANGKGDLRRPAAVPKEQVDREFERIFGPRRDSRDERQLQLPLTR